MKVTLGRIVHYKMMTGEVRPAIVVNVMPSGKVNLQVFLDETGIHWVSSVDFGFGGPEDRLHEFPCGTWRWPPREPG